MFSLFRRRNEEVLQQLKNPYHFLIVEGVGVTYYNVPQSEEIQLHLVDNRNLWQFGQTTLVFPGGLRRASSNLPIIEMKVGDRVRIVNTQTGESSQPLRVDGIFRTPHIAEAVPTDVFLEPVRDGTVDNLHDITSGKEFLHYTHIARGLVTTALLSSSFTVDPNMVMTLSGFETRVEFDRWLDDFIAAGLVVEENQDKIRLCDSLIYLTMHAINRHHAMSGPVFTY